jgi:glycosyltransferase involved in cell wall biosynthesis
LKYSVCILSVQYFGDNKIGGFGSMARQLAEGLASRGVMTSVLVPNIGNRQEYEIINGVHVYSFNYKNPWQPKRLIKQIDADIYHTQNSNLLTRLAAKIMPNKKHLVVCVDPRDTSEFFNEFIHATNKRRIKIPLNYLFEYLLVKKTVANADQVFVPAFFLIDKTTKMFRPKKPVRFLPDITNCSEVLPIKNTPIEVLFLARLDKRKRPEVVFDLIPKFPEIIFNVIGKAEDSERDQLLRDKYSHFDNVRWHGYINKFEEIKRFESIVGGSTAILNSSSREGLPLTFLEAAGMGCAIISTVDPDSFASRFGRFIKVNEFAAALEDLKNNQEKYISLGKKTYEYVRNTYRYDKALDAHIAEYKRIMNEK